jgi:hypothetical protein
LHEFQVAERQVDHFHELLDYPQSGSPPLPEADRWHGVFKERHVINEE